MSARKAVEIKPKTKEGLRVPGLQHQLAPGRPGHCLGVTYSQGWSTDHIYVAPTEKVTQGMFEFSSKFRLYAKELTAASRPEKYALPLDYAQTYSGLPVKVSGDHTVRAVDAGAGTAADSRELDVKGKVAVVQVGAGATADEALANATAAGAGYVLAYRNAPGSGSAWCRA